MTTVLDAIIAGVRDDLAERSSALPLKAIIERAESTPAALPASELLAAATFSVIAEVKRASPSKGELAQISDPATLARSYESGGAGMVSVLTEQRRFHGDLSDLDSVRAAVSIPVLRKDFMVDEYQFFEARAHGADTVLLIVAGLADSQLRDFNQLAVGLGMSVLVEVHDEAELERALVIDPLLVGVNARNLKTLAVDLDVCRRLLPMIPKHIVAVAESGLSSVSDVADMAAHGARAVLVGEALVRTGNPQAEVRSFTEAGETAR
jgi:indole-3-glycerol phosphate synthase